MGRNEVVFVFFWGSLSWIPSSKFAPKYREKKSHLVACRTACVQRLGRRSTHENKETRIHGRLQQTSIDRCSGTCRQWKVDSDTQVVLEAQRYVPPDYHWKAVCLFLGSNFSAIELTKPWKKMGWEDSWIHLRTNEYDSIWKWRACYLSVTTYGMFYEWLHTACEAWYTKAVARYSAIIFDECGALKVKERDAIATVAKQRARAAYLNTSVLFFWAIAYNQIEYRISLVTMWW